MALIVKVIEEESDYITAKVETQCPMCNEWIYQVGVFEKWVGMLIQNKKW